MFVFAVVRIHAHKLSSSFHIVAMGAQLGCACTTPPHVIPCTEDLTVRQRPSAEIKVGKLVFKSPEGKVKEWSGNTSELKLLLTRDGDDDPVRVKACSPGGPAEKGWIVQDINDSPAQSMTPWEVENIVCGPLEREDLTLENLLDIVDDFRNPFVNVMRAALQQVGNGIANEEERTTKVCLAAVKEASEAVTVRPYVTENLLKAEKLPADVKDALRQILLVIDSWQFDTTGRVDKVPPIDEDKLKELKKEGITMKSLSSKKVPQEFMDCIRRLLFAHYPPELSSSQSFYGIYGGLFRGKPRRVNNPVAVITVGAPGCGKSRSTSDMLKSLGLSGEQCVETDPDHWVLNHLGEGQHHYRMSANFCNLECFYYAMAQRHHIVFAGTGARISNTCGRVIARLKQESYDIYVVIILASFGTCRERIARRREETGRDVPEHFSVKAFKDLKDAMPIYVRNRHAYAKAVHVIDNNESGTNVCNFAKADKKVVLSNQVDSQTEQAKEAKALKMIMEYTMLPQHDGEVSASHLTKLYWGCKVRPKAGCKLSGMIMTEDLTEVEAEIPEHAIGTIIHMPLDLVKRIGTGSEPLVSIQRTSSKLLDEDNFEVEFNVKCTVLSSTCPKGRQHKWRDVLAPKQELNLGVKNQWAAGMNVPLGTIVDRPPQNPAEYSLAFLYRGSYKAEDLEIYKEEVEDPNRCTSTKARHRELAELFAKAEKPFFPIPWLGALHMGAGERQEIMEKQQVNIPAKEVLKVLMGSPDSADMPEARLRLALWCGVVASKWGEHEPMNRWFKQSALVKQTGSKHYIASACESWQARGPRWCERATDVLLAICVDAFSLPAKEVAAIAGSALADLIAILKKSGPLDTQPIGEELNAALKQVASKLIASCTAKNKNACVKLNQDFYPREWVAETPGKDSNSEAIRVMSLNILAQGAYGSGENDSLSAGSLNFHDKGFMTLHDHRGEHREAVSFFYRSWRLVEDVMRHGYPSVLMLQELDFFEEYLSPVMEALGYAGKFLQKPPSAVRQSSDGCALFWRLERFKGGVWFHMNYPEEWDDGRVTYWPQVVLGVVLQTRGGNAAFACTHLAAEKSARSEYLRVKQVSQLARKMTQIQKDYDCVLNVVGCDLNSAPLGDERVFGYESEAHRMTLELFDSAYEAILHDEPLFTQWNIERRNPGFPVKSEKVTLDFILNLRNAGEHQVLRPYRVLNLPKETVKTGPMPSFQSTSDHFAVAAEYMVPERKL